MSLFVWRNSEGVVGSPVKGVFVYCLENNNGDGGIDSEILSFRADGATSDSIG